MKIKKIQCVAVLYMMILMFVLSGCTGKGKNENTGTALTAAESAAQAVTDTSSDTAETAATLAVTSALGETSQSAKTGFHIDGTKLLDACGNEFVMRGISYPHSWYASQDDTSFKAIAATGANCIRIVLGCGIQFTKDDSAEIKKLIDMARENRMVAILEVHDITGKDDINALKQVADYWIEVKDALIGNEDAAILNIANEWVGKWDGETWRDGYTQVIPMLREAGINNTILVDSAGWGQYAKSIADYGSDVLAADPQANTMFAVHMYGTAGKDENTIISALTGATGQGLCVCVGEFGYKHTDGDVDENFIMQYCTENSIGYMAWSWKGNSGGVEYLDLAKEWDGSVLSPDWGENVINGTYGIKATSKICTIFDK